MGTANNKNSNTFDTIDNKSNNIEQIHNLAFSGLMIR